jgi:hypothetical protein
MKVCTKQEELIVHEEMPIISVLDREVGYMVALGTVREGQNQNDFCDAIGAVVMTIASKYRMSPAEVMELIGLYVEEAYEAEEELMN